MIKISRLFTGALLSALILCQTARAGLTVQPGMGESVPIATVNGQNINLSDLFRVLQQAGQTDYLKKAMRSTVLEILYSQEAQKMGILAADITETEIQERLTRRIDLVREKLGEPAAARLSKLLEDPVNKVKLYEDTRRQIVVDKVFEKRREEIVKLVEVSAEEIDGFVQKIGNEIVGLQLRHLVVKEEKRAKDILAQIKKGKSFEEMVKKYSTDKKNKDKNGDIGWQSLDDMGPLFDYHLKELKDGQVSKPIKREDGAYSIIKVVARKLAKDSPEALISTAKATIASQKAYKAMEDWSKTLVKQANIQVLMQPLGFSMEDGQ